MPDDEMDYGDEFAKTAEEEYEERLKNIGGVNAAAAKMQADINERIDEIKGIGTKEGIEQVSKATSSVLRSLSAVIREVAVGTKKITIGTALATKEAIGQYGKAISEDISFNKQNIVATSLARATPLFGYFASKFMETDVFKSAATKIKSTLSDAISSVGGKFKSLFATGFERVKGLFGKGKRAEEEVPKLQAGGVIGKAGLAEVHKAEVIMPIEKLLEKIDELKKPTEEAAEIAVKPMRMFSALISGMTRRQHMIEEYTLRRAPDERRSLVKSFTSAYKETFEEHALPWQEQMVRLQRRLVFSLIGLGNRFRIAFSTMLFEHPLLRNLFWSVSSFTKALTSPFRFLVKARGGYEADLPTARNPFENLVQTSGLIYTGMMYQFDKVVAHARAQSEYLRDISGAFTGKGYEQIQEKERERWSFLRKSLRAVSWQIEWLTKKTRGEEEALFWTKPRTFQSLMVDAWRTVFPKEEQRAVLPTGTMQKLDFVLQAIIDRIKPQQEREISIVKQLEYQTEALEDQRPWWKKLLSKTETIKDATQRTARRIRGMGRTALRWIVLAFGFIKNLIGNIGGMAAKFLSGTALPLLTRTIPSLLRPLLSTAVLGPLLAGAGGLALGTLINKYIVDPFMEKRSRELQAKVSKSWQQVEAGMRRTKEASGGRGRGRVEAVHAARMRTTLGGTAEQLKERYYAGGLGGSETYLAIQAAQQKYMEEHIGDYIPYGFDQVQMARIEFAKVAGKKLLFADPEKYGIEREKNFLSYLKSQYKPVGLEALAKTVKSKDILDKAAVAGGVAMEKARGAITDRMSLARGAAMDFIMKTEPIVEAGKRTMMEYAKKAEEHTTAVLSSASNIIQTNTQNVVSQMGGQQQAGDHDPQLDRTLMGAI